MGGGVAGSSVAYHLTKRDIKDVILLEKEGADPILSSLSSALETRASITQVKKCRILLFSPHGAHTGHTSCLPN